MDVLRSSPGVSSNGWAGVRSRARQRRTFRVLPSGLSPHRVLSEGSGHTLLWIARTRRELDAMRLGAADLPVGASTRHVVAGEKSPELPVDVAITDPADRVARRYGVGERGEIFAVRPDGYIGLRTRIDDPSRLRDYMAALCGTAA